MSVKTTFYLQYGKRFLDCFLILLTAGFSIAIILLISAIYLLTCNWPLLFKQKRIGRGEKIFKMYKFRTLNGNDTMSLPERTFWLGKIMRATNLDELPQIWNVLKGDMSLIGPRPLPVEYLDYITPDQRKRHNLLPGISGLAQVTGKNSIFWQQKFDLDIQYLQQVSFTLDCAILIKTCILILAFKKDKSFYEHSLVHDKRK
ncbi:MAG: sugar transferase [Cyclobacteriaceae bacterium]|nr:sugar transferase [Cyclobacteriaceae bacterium]